MQWDLVIGLEVHAQLTTSSKLFSGSVNQFGASANAHCSYVDAALPGTLPVMNQQAMIKAIQFGVAINAKINKHSWFERKNYFYPDLPKGYQISQFQSPIVGMGKLAIRLNGGQTKYVTIERAHLEEDAGKSIHSAHPNYTAVDLNRAGTPLLEIVTTPCLHSAEEAVSYLKTLHQLVRFLGICDGNMQEGSFRCDVNLSLKPKGSEVLGTRTEIKNLNSFKFIEKAILFETKRHKKLLEKGESIIQETRLYDTAKDCTRAMRSKENENDYRYFPDPDLLPLHIEDTLINDIRDNLPILPQAIHSALQQDPHLSEEDISFLLSSPAHYAFYCELVRNLKDNSKTIINWLRGPYAALLNEKQASFSHPPISIEDTAALLRAILDKTLSNSAAKTIFESYLDKSETMSELISKATAGNIADTNTLERIIDNCLQQHPEQVQQYREGKTKLMGFFVGQIMKELKGKTNPGVISQLLKTKLS